MGAAHPHPSSAKSLRDQLRYPPHQGEGGASHVHRPNGSIVSLPLVGRVATLANECELAELGWGYVPQ